MRILPIGTIVKLKNEKHKVMIVSRMISLSFGEKKYYFDYAGCVYPRGIVGEHVANFNEEDIEEVLFEGFVDEDEVREKEIINKWIAETDVKRADLNLIRQVVELKRKEKKENDKEDVQN